MCFWGQMWEASTIDWGSAVESGCIHWKKCPGSYSLAYCGHTCSWLERWPLCNDNNTRWNIAAWTLIAFLPCFLEVSCGGGETNLHLDNAVVHGLGRTRIGTFVKEQNGWLCDVLSFPDLKSGVSFSFVYSTNFRANETYFHAGLLSLFGMPLTSDEQSAGMCMTPNDSSFQHWLRAWNNGVCRLKLLCRCSCHFSEGRFFNLENWLLCQGFPKHFPSISTGELLRIAVFSFVTIKLFFWRQSCEK